MELGCDSDGEGAWDRVRMRGGCEYCANAHLSYKAVDTIGVTGGRKRGLGETGVVG